MSRAPCEGDSVSAKCGSSLAPSFADYNEAGGWADSRMAVVDVLSRVRARGVKFASGEAASLLFSADKKDVKGVTTKGGEEHRADFVILASGAWTGALVPEIAHDLLATGQTVGTIQLSAEEAEEYATIPVRLDISEMLD